MYTHRMLLLAVSAFALTSCNPFRRDAAVQMNTKDEGVFGGADAYRVAKVGRDGGAKSTANLQLTTPTTGSYFVMVRASAANEAVTVACGNLAPPTL